MVFCAVLTAMFVAMPYAILSHVVLVAMVEMAGGRTPFKHLIGAMPLYPHALYRSQPAVRRKLSESPKNLRLFRVVAMTHIVSLLFTLLVIFVLPTLRP